MQMLCSAELRLAPCCSQGIPVSLPHLQSHWASQPNRFLHNTFAAAAEHTLFYKYNYPQKSFCSYCRACSAVSQFECSPVHLPTCMHSKSSSPLAPQISVKCNNYSCSQWTPASFAYSLTRTLGHGNKATYQYHLDAILLVLYGIYEAVFLDSFGCR